jgi:hypothetical protein
MPIIQRIHAAKCSRCQTVLKHDDTVHLIETYFRDCTVGQDIDDEFAAEGTPYELCDECLEYYKEILAGFSGSVISSRFPTYLGAVEY